MDAFWRLLRHGHLHWQDVKTKFIGTYMEAKFAPNFFYSAERLMTVSCLLTLYEAKLFELCKIMLDFDEK